MSEWHDTDHLDWKALLIVGMGNRIKSDDGAGIYISEELRKQGIENIVIAENSIENYIGKINRYKAKTILMIDAVDMEEDPGYFKIVPIEKIQNSTTNTHNLSLRTISSFFETKDQWVLGIQPEKVAFGTGLTARVKSAADRIVCDLLKKYNTNQQILKS
jgi:hydrogenase 3 maturation protease